MSEYIKTYVFLGVGTLWDVDTNKALCSFDRSGKYVCTNEITARKLIRLGVPQEDERADDLPNAECAIEILTSHVHILEQLNEDLKTRLSKYESDKAVDKRPTKEVIMAELDYLGIPYVKQSSDTSLLTVYRQYKDLMRERSKRSSQEYDSVWATDESDGSSEI